MTRILLSILFVILASPLETFGQDYINFYDDVHPRPRWEDMPQSLDASRANVTPEFLDRFFHLLQNRTSTRNENILRSLGESLGDPSYSYLPGSINPRDRFFFSIASMFGGEKEEIDPAEELLSQIVKATLRGEILEAGGKDRPERIGTSYNAIGCDPRNPTSCLNPGYHRCLAVMVNNEPKYKCLCDLHHTELPFTPGKHNYKSIRCMKNVFTQCSMGSKKYKCGENMDCVPDTLHLEPESFCRCKPGFAPAENSRGILAFCRPIIKEADDKEEEEEDFGAEQAHAALILIRHSLLLLSLMSIAVMT